MCSYYFVSRHHTSLFNCLNATLHISPTKGNSNFSMVENKLEWVESIHPGVSTTLTVNGCQVFECYILEPLYNTKGKEQYFVMLEIQ